LNSNIIDIIIFGSFVKGGFYSDIDIALVVKETKNLNDTKEEIRKVFKKETDIQTVTIESIYTSIWPTLIKEGYSIREKKYLFEIYHMTPSVLFKYSLKKLNNVQKVQFERGLKKMLEKEGKVLTRSVILVPINMRNAIKDFLGTWDIYYDSQEYELLPVLRKETFL